MSRYTNPVPRYVDDSGDPLVSGKLYFYETGTSTLADTYADSGQTILNPNPVILSGAGEVPNIFFTGTLKVKLTDNDDVQLWERDPVTSGGTGSILADWESTVTYDATDLVRYNLKYYISLVNNNLDNTPDVSTTQWATWPNGDIVCDSVTADDFIGDLTGDVTGNADTATLAATATNSLSLGGNLASEYLPDYQSDYDTTISVDTATNTILVSINLGTVESGSVISVSGNIQWPLLTTVLLAQIQSTGTATFEMNGETGGTSLVRNGPPASATEIFQNVSALVNVTATGTMVLSLVGNQASGGTINVAEAKIASSYLIKKA